MTQTTLKVNDGTGTQQNLSVNQDATNSNALMSTVNVADPSSGNKVQVAQFHNADNQAPGASAYGLLTGGVAQVLNAAGNIDRQRGTGIDLIPGRGVITGAMQYAFEYQQTSTTSVSAAAATATLSIANTTGFLVGGTLNLEPMSNLTYPANYEQATITAVVANTSVTIAFGPSGALFNHTQPYTVQTFVYNQERDFSGEGPMAMGIGAAIATEFESNSGGPPLASGLPTGWTLDADRNYQGKGNTQMAITSTNTSDTSIVFTNNPWTSGLILGQPLILSATATGAAVEEVIVSKNNIPVTGAGPITVKIVNPVVTSSSVFALFDKFALNGVGTGGATVLGVEDNLMYVNNLQAADPKKPLIPVSQAPGNTGAMLVSSDSAKATYRAAVQAFAPVATPTAFFIVKGSASTTVRIKRIKIGGVATANGNMQAQMSRWSTAGTLGSAVLTALTAVKHDTNDAGATASINTVGTANYTTQGTGNGTLLSADRIFLATVATGATQQLIYDFSTRQDKAFILRGATDILAISGNGSAIPSGGVLDIEIEWEEDAS